MEQQSEGSKQMVQSINVLKDLTQTVKNGATETLSNSREVIVQGQNLGSATAKITSGVQVMAAGTTRIHSAMAEVAGISHENNSSIEVLVQEVGRFKVA
jgi:methyl-accepting chemotaxis protein